MADAMALIPADASRSFATAVADIFELAMRCGGVQGGAGAVTRRDRHKKVCSVFYTVFVFLFPFFFVAPLFSPFLATPLGLD